MMVRLTVRRSAHEIGDNHIEVTESGGSRFLLDISRPLDAPREANDLLPATWISADNLRRSSSRILSRTKYGRLQAAPAKWSVYSGCAAEKLVKLTAAIVGEPITRDFYSWTSGHPFTVGPFTVTAFPTDHSAFDA